MTEETIQEIFIVDDDEPVRDSLAAFLESAGLRASPFANPGDFLDRYRPETGGCLLLDIRMPEMSGLEVQEELLAVGSSLPIIFITGHADVSSAVRALKAGAFDFLQKPFDNMQLLQLVNKALEQDRRNRAALGRELEVRKRLQSLTPRENEVLGYVVNGTATKVIAMELNLSQRTIEIYRANVMQKMQARSVAELVKMTAGAGSVRPA